MARRRGQSMVMNEQTPLSDKIIHYVIGFVLVLYFSILWGAAWRADCSFMEWYDNFMRFVITEHHFIVGFTRATIPVIGFCETVWTLGYLYFITAIQHPFAGREHGDAHWGDIKTFFKEFANHDKKHIVKVNFGEVPEPKTPVYVNTHNYWMAEGMYLNIDNKLTSNLNILIVGPPGTGKSFRVARPILSQLSGNFLVTDPKGELSKQCGKFFEDNGYEVFVLNIESEEAMANSVHFNPFRYLRNESDIMSLSQILFKATKDPEQESGGDAFFEQSAETLCTDLLYLMHYTYPPEDQNWTKFVELLESTTVRSDNKGKIDNSAENCIMKRFEEANKKWKDGVYTKGVPQTENIKGYVDIEKFYHGAQETTSSIVASLDAHCRYMKLQCVKELLSEDEIDIKNSFAYCKKTKRSPTGKRILFIVTSEDKRYYDWITSMVYSMFFEELYHITTVDESLHDRLNEHLTFLMDEFSNVTLPDSFVDRLSTMRSREMSAIVIIQNLMQLKKKFPKFDLDKNLIGNMSVIDILGAPDWDSCEYLSKQFGTMTIHKKTTGLSRGGQGSSSENEDVMQMPLFSAEKMFEMNKDGPCAMVVKGAGRYWVQKCQFQNSPLLPLLTRRKAYVMRRREDIGSKTVFDYSRSPCDQIPELCVGEEANRVLAECEEKGIPVVSISLSDIDNLSELARNNVRFTEFASDATTEEFWEKIKSNTEKLIREKAAKTLNIDQYDKDKILVVQKLRNKGFSVEQIHVLDPLIHKGMPYVEICDYFNPDTLYGEMEDMAARLAAIY